MNIAQLAIKRPVFVVMIVVSIITLGLIGYSRLSVDLLPKIDAPNIFVRISYPGASASQVEQLVTRPLENVLSTVPGLDIMTSGSREGMAFVNIQFKLDVDINFAELDVREKVSQAFNNLPTTIQNAIQAPVIQKMSTDDIPIIFLSIVGNRSLGDLRETVVYDIQPKMAAVEGVGQIDVLGGRNHIVKVAINNSLLKANGISYQQIISAIKNKNISVPSGDIQYLDKDMTVRVTGLVNSVDDISRIFISSSSGKLVRIRDVAKVSFDLDEELTRARVNGTNAVVFQVYKQSGGNTVQVCKNVRDAIPLIQKTLPPDLKIHIIDDSSIVIKNSIKGVQDDILLGALLAVLIVWLFLANFRSTIITAMALPNSLLGAFFLVYIAGFSLNTMTLLSLSLAVGLLIDDSIVVRENIFRYIEEGLSPKEAAVKGTGEVALAVISTTLSILAVFVPIGFLQGYIGKFFHEFGLTVAFALMISLLDAFTTAPMLSAYWYKKTDTTSTKGFFGIFNLISKKWNDFYLQLNRLYHRLLAIVLDHKKAVLAFLVIAMILTFAAIPFIGMNFINSSDPGAFSISLSTNPNSSLDVPDKICKEIEKFLIRQKEVVTAYTLVGQGGLQNGQISVVMKPLKERRRSTQALIMTTRLYIMGKFGRQVRVQLTERNSFGNAFGGGGGGAVNMTLSGYDLDTLDGLSTKIQKVMGEIQGVSDINSSSVPGATEMVLELDPVKTEQLGISAAQLGQVLQDLITGAQVSTYTKNDRDYYIYLQLRDEDKKRISDVRNILITTHNGVQVPVSSICTVRYEAAPLLIRRENQVRAVRITANLEQGYSLSKVVGKIVDSIQRRIVFPTGYAYVFRGQQQQFADLGKQIMLAMLLALLFMYMILASLYNSFIQPFVLMSAIPLALIGVVFAVIITGVDVDIYGFIGLLLVLGLVAKNSILLIDFTNKKRDEGMSIREALLHAGPIRLRPILMTSFAIIFGMLPLALGLNEGSAGRQALPVTVIGGILTSTFLTLFVVPAIYEFIETRLEKRRLSTADTSTPEPEKIAETPPSGYIEPPKKKRAKKKK